MTEDIRTFQHINKYARFRRDLNRRETWKETVDDRVMPFFRKYYGNALHDLEWGILRDALFEEQASFSMRAIQMAGPAAERCAVSLYNPVAGDTLVLTRDGYRPIRELEGKELDVLNVENRWAPATFRGYGKQETFEVVLKSRSSTRPSIRATKEHRWVLCDGTVLPTSELKVGMRIPFAAAPRPEKNLDYYLGVRHGLVFGDGTTLKTQGRATSYAIRLCGESQELLKYFEGVPHSYPPSFDGDPIVYLCGNHATTALKDLPTEHESLSYIYGFLCGWFAADGSVSKCAGQAVLAVSERWMPWLKQNSARVGWVFMNSDVYSADTNYGKRKEPLHRVAFYAGSLLREDMLLSRKAENFKDKARTFFHVESVTATGVSEDVFCAHVPDTNTFVLNNGVVTGNCAFTPIETLEDFSEILYILMQGTGCAFSVERQFTDKLPAAAEWYEPATLDHVVKDSTEGWCDALAFGLRAWWAGKDVYFDYSGVRPAGARLQTKGGYASGPKPLKELLDFARSIIRDAQGRKLRPLEVHRIACKIGKIVEVGGVRRAAMLSLSDLDDLEMRAAKNGEFWNEMPELTMANNSVAYGPEVDWNEFDVEWENLRTSGSGERGIFNRPAKGARGRDLTLCGTNPCSEINLKPHQFCNLTIAIIRPGDTKFDIRSKVEAAAVMGTLQAGLTHFQYIRPIWKENSDAEALLGVDLMGALDNPHLQDEAFLEELRNLVIGTNTKLAERLGINPSAATTCIKPGGNSGERYGTGNSISGWHARQYIRRVCVNNVDPMCQFLKDQGVPYEPKYNGEPVTVFSFLKEAPAGAIIRSDRTVQDQLEWWLKLKTHWCEHNPSTTIYVRPGEWDFVKGWVKKHWNVIIGLSFLPYDGSVYKQAPFEEVSPEVFAELKAGFPRINWNEFAYYEALYGDTTTVGQEPACMGGVCEL